MMLTEDINSLLPEAGQPIILNTVVLHSHTAHICVCMCAIRLSVNICVYVFVCVCNCVQSPVWCVGVRTGEGQADRWGQLTVIQQQQ